MTVLFEADTPTVRCDAERPNRLSIPRCLANFTGYKPDQGTDYDSDLATRLVAGRSHEIFALQ